MILREAMERWKAMRDDFELVRHAQYERAHAELNGELLSRRGLEEGIDPYSLFMGPFSRVAAYASEELIRWWQDRDHGNGRWTVEEYERQWVEAHRHEEEDHG